MMMTEGRKRVLSEMLLNLNLICEDELTSHFFCFVKLLEEGRRKFRILHKFYTKKKTNPPCELSNLTPHAVASSIHIHSLNNTEFGNGKFSTSSFISSYL